MEINVKIDHLLKVGPNGETIDNSFTLLNVAQKIIEKAAKLEEKDYITYKYNFDTLIEFAKLNDMDYSKFVLDKMMRLADEELIERKRLIYERLAAIK